MAMMADTVREYNIHLSHELRANIDARPAEKCKQRTELRWNNQNPTRWSIFDTTV